MTSPYLTLDEVLDFIDEMCGEIESKPLQDGKYAPTPLSEFAPRVYRILHSHRGRCSDPHEDWKLKK